MLREVRTIKTVGIMYTRPIQPEGKSETLKITFGNGRVERLEFTYEKETAPGKVEILTGGGSVPAGTRWAQYSKGLRH